MKISKKRLAEIWCELNCWKAPKELKPALSKNQAWGAMVLIKCLLPQKLIDDTWNRFSDELMNPHIRITKRKPREKGLGK